VKPDEETEQLGEGEGGMMNGEGTLLPVEWPPRKSGPPIVTVGAIMKSCASRRGLYWCFNGTAGSASVGNLVRHEAVQDAVNAERKQLRKKSLKLAQKQRKAEKKKLAADAQVYKTRDSTVCIYYCFWTCTCTWVMFLLSCSCMYVVLSCVLYVSLNNTTRSVCHLCTCMIA